MAAEAIAQTSVSVFPAWMTSRKCIKQYRLGRAWYQCSKHERLPGPLTERYLLNNLKWMSKKGLLNGKHDEWALEHLGFVLGMLSQEV